MKRYLLFAGSAYFPCGGWGDLLGDFEEIKYAKLILLTLRKMDKEWWHIVDTTTGSVVECESDTKTCRSTASSADDGGDEYG